jgi:hypothetical protein
MGNNVGLDVPRDGTVVAVAEGGLRSEVRDYGRIANTPAALQRLARKLGHEGVELRPARAATASNVTCRRTGTNALWWRRR